jgi:PhzF family phenazine biosynthesis protein
VSSEDEIRTMVPDFSTLSQIPMQGVIVTSRASTPGFDFVSRFFAPSVGINEDPVTGSAHGCLAPYWQKKLKKKYVKSIPGIGAGRCASDPAEYARQSNNRRCRGNDLERIV